MVCNASCEDLLDAIDENYDIYGEKVGRWCSSTPDYPEDEEEINPPEWADPILCGDDEPLDPMEDLIDYLEDK